MDGAGRTEMGPFYCPIHYLSRYNIPCEMCISMDKFIGYISQENPAGNVFFPL